MNCLKILKCATNRDFTILCYIICSSFLFFSSFSDHCYSPPWSCGRKISRRDLEWLGVEAVKKLRPLSLNLNLDIYKMVFEDFCTNTSLHGWRFVPMYVLITCFHEFWIFYVFVTYLICNCLFERKKSSF